MGLLTNPGINTAANQANSMGFLPSDDSSNPYWNGVDFMFPGTSFLNSLFDVDGSRAAKNQFEYQRYLDSTARQFSSEEAEKQRDWEERMSNTSIQRAAADYKAAGLNPWLAVQNGGNGAAVPAGASATAQQSGNVSMANNKLAVAAGIIATALRMFLTKH